ncbi:ABC transporter permease [Aestuariirhabdus sp. Z084]|uniref:ABC transporter permease n=1 Tax=Aestuariirhabdus haliotis TaxID=2918751 RepID=UPI00201B35D2|nr:ABC transporter permease [Aestuariirhabdus haliotis]MCL6416298.1 ABC transporter permease [Aestuariirhabdus haliotis]MCL6420171.1 ABC transporter permease [Aestuariirhabdus haliotis]
MSVLSLAWKSLLSRRTTALLTLLSIAISVSLLLGVETIRQEAKRGFTQTLSGTDLIVGARTGPVQLMLYSVFRIGDATNNIRWSSYQQITQHPQVKWSIPISLGDSHRGYRVLGTTDSYLNHYRYGNRTPLTVAEGDWFNDLHDAVLGYEVAQELGYSIDSSLILSHGTGKVSFADHSDNPFKVSGILAPTGTPVDRTIHVSLQAIEAIHQGWESGAAPRAGAPQKAASDLQPESITAIFVGLKSRIATFSVQREINQLPQEPLLAILPGVTLRQLWNLIGNAEKALFVISVFVVAAGLIGMLTTILTSLNERRREMAILRALGARPRHIFTLMLSESVILASLGCFLGLALLYFLLLLAQPLVNQLYGIQISIRAPGLYELSIITSVISGALIIGLLPAWRAYKNSLSDGLSLRL